MAINKTGNWRLDYDWTDKNDCPVDEAEQDCEKIQEVLPFTDYETNVIQLNNRKDLN